MRKVFLNVVILALLLAIGAGVVMGILASIGAASIVIPVGVSVTVGFLTVALVFARRTTVTASGRVTRLSINALALFLAAWIVFPAALKIGGAAFLDSIVNGVDPVSVSKGLLLAQVGPVAAAAVGVLMAFAKGDDAEDSE